MGMRKCYVCGSIEIANDAPPGGALCEDCEPVREHVVSMQTGAGGTRVAVCRCGWRDEFACGDHDGRKRAVKLHWFRVLALALEAD